MWAVPHGVVMVQCTGPSGVMSRAGDGASALLGGSQMFGPKPDRVASMAGRQLKDMNLRGKDESIAAIRPVYAKTPVPSNVKLAGGLTDPPN